MMMAVLGLAIIGVLACLILHFENVIKVGTTAIAGVGLVALAMVLRGLCMDHETLDYQNFLTRWVQFFAENGHFKALGRSVGNYNVPYLYFLAAFSLSGVRDLYLIKLLSVFFDVVLAWGVMRIVYHFTGNRLSVLASFFVTLFLPTVVLNGAYWGQCDSIYASFIVWSLYFALAGRGAASMALAAVAFSFKLQAVFVFPVFLLFLVAGKIKWRHLAVFPLTYVIMVLPAVLMGRPFVDTLTLYLDQAGTVGSGLNYNSPSAFAFVRGEVDTELYSALGIAAAFAFVLAVCAVCIARRMLSDRTLLVCAALFAVAVPFLLPHMHDRYFFVGDVLTVVLAFVFPVLIPVPILVSFASLLGYHAYLKMRYLLPMRFGAAALLPVIAALFITLFVIEAGSGKKVKKRC